MQKSAKCEHSRTKATFAGALILLTGIVAALGAGKLPPVLPQIRADLGMSLMQAGYLVPVFQIAGSLLGLLGGPLADRYGHQRVMLFGLLCAAAGSFGGAVAHSAATLLMSRALESLGGAVLRRFVLSEPTPEALQDALRSILDGRESE